MMSGGVIGALVGGVMVGIALLFLMHPRTTGQRVALFSAIIGVATIPPMVGSLIDAEFQKQADQIAAEQAAGREHSAREEIRGEFQVTRRQMDLAVRKILTAFSEFPPGPRRTRAIQSALLDYDRAASRLAPASGVVEEAASLLTLTIGAPDSRPAAQREERGGGESREGAASPEPDVLSTEAREPEVLPGAIADPIPMPMPPPPIFIPPPPIVMQPPPPPPPN